MEIRKIKILAIDDIPDNLISLKALIREAFPEATVHTAMSGKRGLELSIQEDPDVILLDIVMPEMDGFEVCKKLKTDQRLIDIPVVFVTAQGDKESRIKALECGGEAFLAKPVDESELTAQIRAMVKIKTANTDKRNENKRLKQLVDERTEALLEELKERKKAEALIKVSEERFRHISSSISDISYSCVIDKNGNSRIDWLYGAIEEITGYTPDELMALKCWGKLVVDEDFPIFKRHILEAMPGCSDECQLRIWKKDGNIVWVNSTSECVKDANEKSSSIIYGGLVDISNRKHAEQALQASESQFREFFEKAADAIFIADIESGIIVDANEAASRLMLRQHDELVGIHQSELHPKTKEDYTTDTFNTHKEQVKQKITSYAIENTVVRADGIEVPVEILASKVDFHGKHCMMGTFRDITERKRASEALMNSLSLTESTLESIHNGILVVDYDGRVVKTSKRFAEMWQISEEVLATGNDKILMNSILDQLTDPENFVAVVQDLYKTPEAESQDLIYFKDGRIFERISKPMYFEGLPKGRVWSFLDITDRKRTEAAFRESQSLYHSFIEQLPNAVFRKDKEGRFILANSQFFKFKGLTGKDLIGLTPTEAAAREIAVNGEHGNATKYALVGEDLHQQIMQTGKMFESEEEYSNEDGSIQYMHVLRMPVIDSHGIIIGSQGIMFDITQRKLAEKGQEEIFEFDQSLLKTIPFGMDIVDEQGNILFVNENLENVFGKGVVGRKCWDIYCDEKEQCNNCPLHKGIEIGKTNTHEAKNIMGGMVFEITYTGMMFKGKKAMLEIFIDITERKIAEDLLNESQQLFQGLFNASPDAIVLIDPHHPTISWPIIDCNDASCKMNGYTREEMIGQSIDLLNSREGTPEERDAYFSLLKQKGIMLDEFVHRNKDGHIFPVEVSTSIVNLSGKELILGIDRDITQRKQAEEKLKKSYDLLNKLAAQVPGVVYQYRLYPDGRSAFPYSSPGMFDIYEVTSEEVREDASPVFTRIHPDDYNAIVESIYESARSQSFYHSEFRVILPKQGLRWRMCDAKPELLDDGSTLWHGIIMDITERKLVEEALNENNSRLQLAMRAANLAWWEMDIASGNVTFESRKAEMLGYPPEMFKHYTDFMNLVHPDDYEPTMDAMRAHFYGSADKYEAEYRILTKSGEYKWFYDIGSILKWDSKGKPLIVAGLVLNITERKSTEVALKASEDRYRGFISQVSEGVYRFESDEPMSLDLPVEEQIDFIYDHMFVAECNEAFLKMYGLSNQKEIIGKSHLDFHNGRNNHTNRDLLRKFVLNNYSIENGITEEFDRSGHLMYISNNSLGIIEDNHLLRMWGTQIDITEKVRADNVQKVLYSISNAALSSVHLAELIEIISKQLGTLLDSTNFYIAFLDEESGTLSTHYEKDEKDEINSWPAEKSMTGYVIKNRKSLLATEADVIKLCESGDVEIVGTPSKIWLGVPLSVNKKVIGAIVVQSYDNPEAYNEKDKQMLEFISHQVSISIERKKAEQEMRDLLLKAQESDRLKSAFLANMSHEIRTPLNSIIGFAELLLDTDFNAEQHDEFARMISSSGNGLLAIITDIMDLSKIEAGQIQINPCRFSVQQLLNGIRKEYSHKANSKGIDLLLDPENPKEDLIIESDELRLKQVLINFVGNAIKFTEKGSIEIGLRTTKDSVYFSVKDTGIGIPNEYHSKIFERFRQVESPYSRKYGGNGLGLAISKSLIELLGGEIGMKSESGKGSTFYFTIPLV